MPWKTPPQPPGLRKQRNQERIFVTAGETCFSELPRRDPELPEALPENRLGPPPWLKTELPLGCPSLGA